MWSSFMSDDWKPDFPNWKARFPDLVWWLDLTGDLKAPRGSLHKSYRDLRDNTTGEVWKVRVNPAGIPLIGPVNANPEGLKVSWAEKRRELKYDVWQYSLIIWCLQKRSFEGWDMPSCFRVIRHFWHNLPGQAPLTSRSLNMWWAVHNQFKKDGILWP